MTPGRLNFTCPQGSTFQRTVTYKIENVPVNLTGYSGRLQVRETHDATDYIVSLINGSGITMGGSAGTIGILIADDVTANFITGDHVYDLEIESANGTTTRLIEGRFNVTPEVTR
jgi:Na+/serine symporter